MARDRVALECCECRSRNYSTTKNKRTHPERVEQRKYCARCSQHTLHRESR